MRYLIRLAAVGWLLLLLALPALVEAQGRTLITDPGGRLNEQAVRDAARPLLNRGATVAIYFVDRGDADDLLVRLRADGLARSDGALLSTAIIIYVAFAPENYSNITFGDRWSDALAVNDNYESIRRGQLNPGLSDGDYTRGAVTALEAIEQAIINPPSPGGEVNVDFIPVIMAVLGLVFVGTIVVVVSRGQQAARARATAEQRLKDAREAVGALITDMGLRFRSVEEKSRFDKVSYSAQEVTRLAQLQGQVVSQFAQVQTSFKAVGEQLERYEKPTNEQLLQAASGYDQVRAEAEQVNGQLQELEQRRVQLDDELRAAREALEQAKKA